MHRIILAGIGALAALAFSGCALFNNEHAYDTVESRLDHVKFAVKPEYRSIAVLPFFNDAGSPNAALYARRAFYGALAGYKNYQLKTLKETDDVMAGLTRTMLDPEEFETLGRNLKTDLLAFGWVVRQRHRYGLIYNRSLVEARIILIDARTGQKVFEAEDYRSRLLMGFSLVSMFEDEYMWAREVNNRYAELFRDMMQDLPDRLVK